MNGGLLAAVSGRDFIVIATDTRLTGATGYDILDRHHIASRLWAATPLSPMQSSLSISHAEDSLNGMFAPDGSLNAGVSGHVLKSDNNKSNSTASLLRVLRELQHSQLPPVVIGSVGCQADCEHLKRSMRADVRAAMYFGEVSSHSQVDAMAIALSQTLYSRRGFPFGTYCVLGGLSSVAGGQVYVYDAIGSYEQVAISCTGTGFELLQPILDRTFTPYVGDGDSAQESIRSGNMIQRPPTQVSCPTVEEAVANLLAAYRSVAEREIGVGDHLVFYTVQKVNNDQFLSKIWTVALKKH
jgi:20S proteasome subunit beta 6